MPISLTLSAILAWLDLTLLVSLSSKDSLVFETNLFLLRKQNRGTFIKFTNCKSRSFEFSWSHLFRLLTRYTSSQKRAEKPLLAPWGLFFSFLILVTPLPRQRAPDFQEWIESAKKKQPMEVSVMLKRHWVNFEKPLSIRNGCLRRRSRSPWKCR